MKNEQIIAMDFYDFCGVASIGMTDSDKIEWYLDAIVNAENFANQQPTIKGCNIMTIETKLNELSTIIHEGNKERGFDVSKANIGQTLMLIVSELSEALEADRKGSRNRLDAFKTSMYYARLSNDDFDTENENCAWIKNRFETTIKDTFEDEIADTVIRLLDLCGGLNIDIESHIDLKLRYNATRPYKHNKEY